MSCFVPPLPCSTAHLSSSRATGDFTSSTLKSGNKFWISRTKLFTVVLGKTLTVRLFSQFWQQVRTCVVMSVRKKMKKHSDYNWRDMGKSDPKYLEIRLCSSKLRQGKNEIRHTWEVILDNYYFKRSDRPIHTKDRHLSRHLMPESEGNTIIPLVDDYKLIHIEAQHGALRVQVPIPWKIVNCKWMLIF